MEKRALDSGDSAHFAKQRQVLQRVDDILGIFICDLLEVSIKRFHRLLTP